MTPPRPRPPRDLDPRRVADARAGLASASRSSATIPFLVAAASRHSTARGSGRFATFVRAELSLGSRKTLRLLRFVPKLAYGLGSGRLNATARAGASFSAPPDARGAGRSEAIDARFAASALCARREGTVRDGSRRAENASGGDSRRRLGKPPASRARGEETPGVAETRGSSGRGRRAEREPARGGREATAGRTTGGGT